MLKRESNKVICGIYKITSPSGKIYIGQSIDIYKRTANYRCGHCKNQTYLYHSIKKYGWEAHSFKIINVCEPEELAKLEKYYVDLFDTFNSQYGLNVKDGGGESGKMAEETKRKIGIKSKGRKFSDEVKKRIGYLSSLKKLSPSHKEKFTFNGKNHSDKWKQDASVRNSRENNPMFGNGHKLLGDKNGMYGKKRKRESIEKYCRVILNTQNGIFYFGAKEAATSMNLHWPTLKNRLNGNIKNNTSFVYV